MYTLNQAMKDLNISESTLMDLLPHYFKLENKSLICTMFGSDIAIEGKILKPMIQDYMSVYSISYDSLYISKYLALYYNILSSGVCTMNTVYKFTDHIVSNYSVLPNSNIQGYIVAYKDFVIDREFAMFMLKIANSIDHGMRFFCTPSDVITSNFTLYDDITGKDSDIVECFKKECDIPSEDIKTIYLNGKCSLYSLSTKPYVMGYAHPFIFRGIEKCYYGKELGTNNGVRLYSDIRHASAELSGSEYAVPLLVEAPSTKLDGMGTTICGDVYLYALNFIY